MSINDSERFKTLTEQYMTAINEESLGVDFFENWTFDEAIHTDLEMLKEIDSFHFKACVQCGFYNYKKPSLERRELLNEEMKKLFDELQEKYRKEEPRKLNIKKGKFLWVFVCTKCNKPQVKNKADNSLELKKLVSDFLNR